jgi:undecaprenyl-diphosphatase
VPNGPRARAAVVLLVSFLLLTAVVVGWGWLLTHPLAHEVDPSENALAKWFAAHRTGGLDVVADVGTFVGETVVGALALLVVGVAVAVWRRTVRPVVYVVVGYGSLGVLYVAATTLDPRRRPPVHILDPGLVPTHSFPSGHTATATAVCLCVLALAATYAPRARRWLLVLLVLPPLTLLSRLYQGAHHLSDVLTALVYATAWVLVTTRVLLPREVRVSGRAAPAGSGTSSSGGS